MDKNELQKRMEQAIRLTAPGQPIRTALDMIIAGHLGALICVGDTENVLAAGNDGFPLNISFTSNRLFELSKMDGASLSMATSPRSCAPTSTSIPIPRLPRVRRACVTVLPLACRCSPMPS